MGQDAGRAARAARSAIRATVSVLLLVVMNHRVSPCQQKRKRKLALIPMFYTEQESLLY